MTVSAPTMPIPITPGGERGIPLPPNPDRTIGQGAGPSGPRHVQERPRGILAFLRSAWDRLTNQEQLSAARQTHEHIAHARPAAQAATPTQEAPEQVAPTLAEPTADARAEPAVDADTETAATDYTETPKQSAAINQLFKDAARSALNAGSIEGLTLAAVGQHVLGSTAIGAEMRRGYLQRLSKLRGTSKRPDYQGNFAQIKQQGREIFEQLPHSSESPTLAFFQDHKDQVAALFPSGTDVDAIFTKIREGKIELRDLVNELQVGESDFSIALSRALTGKEEGLPIIGKETAGGLPLVGQEMELLRVAGIDPKLIDVLRVKQAKGEWKLTSGLLLKYAAAMMFSLVFVGMFTGEADGGGGQR